LEEDELVQFADAVLDRFRNPYIKHQLKSIALNSISKFKVRVLPSLLKYAEDNGVFPCNLTFAFACLIRFYKGTWKGIHTPINDDQDIIDFFKQAWNIKDKSKMLCLILSKEEYWGQDLTEIPDLLETLFVALEEIEKNDIEIGYNNFKSRK
jgi:tagaturonate reductase